MPASFANVTSERTDLVFHAPWGDVGLMLYRPPRRDGALDRAELARQFGPREEQQQLFLRDVPVVYQDMTGGAGVSRPYGAIRGYSEARSFCWRYPGIGTPGGYVTSVPIEAGVTGVITSMAEFGGDVYFCCGRYLLKVTGGDAAEAVIAADLGAGFIADGMAVFDNALWIGGYNGYLKKWSGGVISSSTDIAPGKLAVLEWQLGGDLATGLAGIATGGRFYNVLLGTTGDNGSAAVRFVPSGSDPLVAANWRSYIPVGDSSYPILRIVASNGHAYFTKKIGVYDMDETGRTPNLAHTFRDNQHASNGLSGYVYDGALFVSHGFGKVRIPLGDLTRHDVPEEAGFGHGLPNESGIQGWSLDFTNENGWLAELIYSPITGATHLVYGQHRTRLGIPGPGPLLHHGDEAYFPGFQGSLVRPASPGNAPRLWVAGFETSGGAPKLYWVSLPKASTPYQDLMLGGPMRFSQTGSTTFTTADWGQHGLTKNVDRIILEFEGWEDGAAFAVQAAAESGPAKSFTLQGQAKGQFHTRMLPVGEARSAKEITARIDYTGPSEHPGLFRLMKLDASIVQEQTPVLTLPIAVGPGLLDRVGEPITDDPELMRAQIDAMMGKLMTMTDHRGRTLTVRVEQGISDQISEHPSEDGWVGVIGLRVSVLSSQAAYGDAYYDTWDIYGG